MPSALAGPEAARVLQWLEDGSVVVEHVRRIRHEYDQAAEAARVVQAEQERLQQEGEALRQQVRQLHAELVRLQKQRADAARWVAAMIREAAARFPLTPPPA